MNRAAFLQCVLAWWSHRGGGLLLLVLPHRIDCEEPEQEVEDASRHPGGLGFPELDSEGPEWRSDDEEDDAPDHCQTDAVRDKPGLGYEQDGEHEAQQEVPDQFQELHDTPPGAMRHYRN